MTIELAFSDFAMLATEDNPAAVQHLFLSHKRLGPVNGTEVDIPNLSGPIAGNASLQLQYLDDHLAGQIYHTKGETAGWASGYIRSQVNAQILDAAAFGFYCYAESGDLRDETKKCYLLGLSAVAGSTTARLAKSLHGFADIFTGGGLLAATAQAVWPIAQTFCIQLQWLPTTTGLLLEYWQGTTFASMTRRLAVRDASPFVTTSGQGIWASSENEPGLNVFFDNTGYKKAIGHGE